MGFFRSTAPSRRESDAEGDPPPGRWTRTTWTGSAVRVCVCVCECGRRATRRCMCVWAADGWLAETRRWAQARDNDDKRDRMTWTLPLFLPFSLFSSTPTHAPAANLPRGRGTK